MCRKSSAIQIESGLYERQAADDKISNFENRLPAPQSELAVQTMKDPYIFDFISFKEDMVERDVENALVKEITELLLESEGIIDSIAQRSKVGKYLGKYYLYLHHHTPKF